MPIEVELDEEQDLRERAKTELTNQAKESILSAVAKFAVTLGKGAASLVDRLRGVRDPDAAIAALDGQLAANRARREPLSARYEKLYSEIAAKKKVYLAAPPAKKKILELELRGLVAEYQGLERQLAVYFENERMVNVVRSRTLELVAMGLRKISEKDVDSLVDDVEDAVGEQEGVSEAMRDLENAGRRRETDDADAFADALAGFDETADPLAEPPSDADAFSSASESSAPERDGALPA